MGCPRLPFTGVLYLLTLPYVHCSSVAREHHITLKGYNTRPRLPGIASLNEVAWYLCKRKRANAEHGNVPLQYSKFPIFCTASEDPGNL